MKPSDFQVGQKVVAVYTRNRRTPSIEPATVTAVGRKWVSFEVDGLSWQKDRFDPEDMAIDAGNYASPGRVYLSITDYETGLRLWNAWLGLRRRVADNYSRPAGMTAERMAEFMKGFDDA